MDNAPTEQYIMNEEVVAQEVIGEDQLMEGEQVVYEEGIAEEEVVEQTGDYESEGPSEAISESFHVLCQAVDPDMDANFKLDSWRLYQKVYGQCCLEGSEAAWLVAAIYIQQQINKGSKFSVATKFKYTLGKVLAAGRVSPLEFFDRVTRFVEMCTGPPRLQQQCQRIQASLAVSAVVYKKYLPLFRRVFTYREPSDSLPSPSHSTLFQFIWLLYLGVKRFMPNQADDLMTCFHCLLCCVDVMVRCLMMKKETQKALNQEFVSLCCNSKESEVILEMLCKWFDGVTLDAKHFKTHVFENCLAQAINDPNLPSFMDNLHNFMDSLSDTYEDHLLRKGECDERMFIPGNIDLIFDEAYDTSAIELLRRSEQATEWSVDTELLLRMSTQSCLEKIDRGTTTPLSGKAYIMSSEQFCPMTPSSSNTVSPTRLLALVPEGWTLDGSDLQRWLIQFRDNPLDDVVQMVEQLGQRFENRVNEERLSMDEGYDAIITDNADKHRDLATQICYRLLEKVIIYERDRQPYRDVDVDFTAILRKDEFIASAFGVAMELLLYCYGSQREFPWIIDSLRLPPVHFYKVIELIVRAEQNFTREMVKHLNRVEERVLEELSWTPDSPLWPLLARRADGVPSCMTVWMSDLRELYSPAKRRRMDEEELPQSSSLTLFFRKIYFLASIRLVDLCDRLKIDDKSRNKIWTLVEYFLRTETSLMAGRHLDQNLMCCVYMICRLSKTDVTFNMIMQNYKMQPQATSRVYRNVAVEVASQPPPPPPPTEPTVCEKEEGTSRGFPKDVKAEPQKESSAEPPATVEHVDLIRYYNRVFMTRMEDFVKRVDCDGSVPIIPLPVLRPFGMTPHKRMVTDRITVQPLTSATSNTRPLVTTMPKMRSPVKVVDSRSMPVRRFVTNSSGTFSTRPGQYYTSASFGRY